MCIARSGAFLQQCWSVHPLCLGVKRKGADRTLVVSCSSCHLAHYLLVGLVEPRDSSAHKAPPSNEIPDAVSGEHLLHTCLTVHRASVTLCKVDVCQDLVLLRCADCRRYYTLKAAGYETHQL